MTERMTGQERPENVTHHPVMTYDALMASNREAGIVMAPTEKVEKALREAWEAGYSEGFDAGAFVPKRGETEDQAIKRIMKGLTH